MIKCTYCERELGTDYVDLKESDEKFCNCDCAVLYMSSYNERDLIFDGFKKVSLDVSEEDYESLKNGDRVIFGEHQLLYDNNEETFVIEEFENVDLKGNKLFSIYDSYRELEEAIEVIKKL